MKNTLFVLMMCSVLALPVAIFAQGNKTGQGIMEQERIQDPGVDTDTTTPPGNEVQNRNEVQTQNQGEDGQLEIETRESENYGDGQGEGLQNRNQNALEHMSRVATHVQQLLQVRTTGGIGEQVRQVAQEQNQAQIQIQEQVHKLDSRGQFARWITGTDYQAVKNLKAQLEQNRVRVEKLEQLENQLTNQEDAAMVRETIEALIQQDSSIREIISDEEQTKSLLGWLFRFLARG